MIKNVKVAVLLDLFHTEVNVSQNVVMELLSMEKNNVMTQTLKVETAVHQNVLSRTDGFVMENLHNVQR